MKPCKECAMYKRIEICPYDFKHSTLKSNPSKTRESFIKMGYEDCFWTTSDVKQYNQKEKKK